MLSLCCVPVFLLTLLFIPVTGFGASDWCTGKITFLRDQVITRYEKVMGCDILLVA